MTIIFFSPFCADAVYILERELPLSLSLPISESPSLIHSHMHRHIVFMFYVCIYMWTIRRHNVTHDAYTQTLWYEHPHMIEHMFICDLNFVDIGMAHICITFLFLLNIYVHISFLVKCIFFSLAISFKNYAPLTLSKRSSFSASFNTFLTFVDFKISSIYKSMHFLLSTPWEGYYLVW